jgi:hypothetical protein
VKTPDGIGPYRTLKELPPQLTVSAKKDESLPLPIRRHPVRFSLKVLFLCFFSAYTCAIVHVAAIQWSLPPTDGAYEQGLLLSILDPFVITIAGFFASIVAVAVFPIALFCLWYRDLLRCGLLVLGSCSLYVFVVTPFATLFAMYSAPILAVGILLFCRFTPFLFLQPQHRPWLAA